jgi:hypothetical protein
MPKRRLDHLKLQYRAGRIPAGDLGTNTLEDVDYMFRSLMMEMKPKFKEQLVQAYESDPHWRRVQEVICGRKDELIWPCIERALTNATEAEQKWVTERYRSMSMFIDGAAEIKDPLDARRLGFLHRGTIRILLEKGTVVDHAQYFPFAADLLCLTRSISSRIPMDFGSNKWYDCNDILKPVFVKTITTEFQPEETAEQQYQHRGASRRFVRASKASGNQKKCGPDDRPVYPVAEMRELQLTTASTKLRVFNNICTFIGKDSLIDSTSTFRDNGLDGWAFARFICLRTGTPLPSTTIEYLSFVCDVLPLLRTLIKQVCAGDMYLSPCKNGKLFVLDDTPLVAMFLTWLLT